MAKAFAVMKSNGRWSQTGQTKPATQLRNTHANHKRKNQNTSGGMDGQSK